MSVDPWALEREDYEEPRCVLCGDPPGAEAAVRPIPQQRILAKVDEYMGRRDYAGVEKLLLYWLEEAKLGRDQRGELMVRNEMVGHYRKTGEKEKALQTAGEALDLLREMDFEESFSAGTTYVNVATACHAFGDLERALHLFEKARGIYESGKQARPDLLGGLYNNMALALAAQKKFSQARVLYEKALHVMKLVPNGVLEQAITYLNMANALEDELGLEQGEKQIEALLDKAQDLLDTPSVPRDGYYAFVCEKCAPTFSYYGYFLAAEELKKRAEEIYDAGRGRGAQSANQPEESGLTGKSNG